MAGYGQRFWLDLPVDLLEDLREYTIAKRFSVQPWEAGDIPEYWIVRAQLFDKVLDQVHKHLNRGNESEE